MAVLILTYNEESNLRQALDSVAGWCDETFVLDSVSTDATAAIARSYGCTVVTNRFENYAKQRNYALDNLPITAEWVLFLDADEWLPEAIKREISALVKHVPRENGFYLNRRLIWMGRWIRRGYYPSWILRLFRHGEGRCEDRAVNEHMLVEGATGRLRSDFVHEDRKGITDWIAKHNVYATLEARELFNTRTAPGYKELGASLFGTQAQRRRWLRYRVWNRMPPLVRPFFYFFYRYVLVGGFLDGVAAFTYHFLQALWYPLLIDLKYLELKQARSQSQASRGDSSAEGRRHPSGEDAVPAGIRFHEALAHSWNRSYTRRGGKRRLAFVKELLSRAVHPGENWLDAGCGAGILTLEMSRLGATGLAVDGSQRMVDAALQEVASQSQGFSFAKVVSIASVDIQGGALDGVLCSSVIEYVESVDDAFSEFNRVLKTGGKLVLSVPNRHSPIRRGQKMLRSLGSRLGWDLFPYLSVSRHEFAKDELLGQLSRSGFSLCALDGFDPVLPRRFVGVLPPALYFLVAERLPS